jgi:general secretion pathway protein A
MYNRYFGFRESPFSVTPDPGFLYTNPFHLEALASLHYGITAKKGLIVITGEVGTGKTTLLRKLMRTLESSIHSVFIFNMSVDFRELLQLTLRNLGLTIKEKDPPTMIEQLNDYLIEQLKQGHTVALVIDEAQNLTDEVFEGIRVLSNLETDKEKLLQIVLVGQPELKAKLDQPSLRHMKQRVALHCQLAPLNGEEVGRYIDSRLRDAGYEGEDLFSPDATEQIGLYSRGIPRLINIICDNALTIAYGTSQTKVTMEMIDEVAYDLRLTSPAEVAAMTMPTTEAPAEFDDVNLSAPETPTELADMTIPAAEAPPEFAPADVPAEVPIEIAAMDLPAEEVPIEIAAINMPETETPEEVASVDMPTTETPTESAAMTIPAAEAPPEFAPAGVPAQVPIEIAAMDLPAEEVRIEVAAINMPETEAPEEVASVDMPTTETSPEVTAMNMSAAQAPGETVTRDVPTREIPTELAPINMPATETPTEVAARNAPATEAAAREAKQRAPRKVVLHRLWSQPFRHAPPWLGRMAALVLFAVAAAFFQDGDLNLKSFLRALFEHPTDEARLETSSSRSLEGVTTAKIAENEPGANEESPRGDISVERKAARDNPTSQRPKQGSVTNARQSQLEHPQIQGKKRESLLGTFEVASPSLVRATPSSDAEIIATLQPHTQVKVVSTAGSYFRVQSTEGETIRGYVHREDAFFVRSENSDLKPVSRAAGRKEKTPVIFLSSPVLYRAARDTTLVTRKDGTRHTIFKGTKVHVAGFTRDDNAFVISRLGNPEGFIPKASLEAVSSERRDTTKPPTETPPRSRLEKESWEG